jgi:hypothetical protein
MKSHSVGIQLGGILGMIGLFVMGKNTWLGIGLILAGAAIVALSIWKPSIPQRPRVRVQESRKATPSVEKIAPVTPRGLSLLKRTLYQANLDPRAAVVVDNGKTLLNVQDILVKLIQVADTQGISMPELAQDITKIYKHFFDNVGRAVAQYPGDPDRLALWLANRALKDAREKLEIQE